MCEKSWLFSPNSEIQTPRIELIHTLPLPISFPSGLFIRPACLTPKAENAVATLLSEKLRIKAESIDAEVYTLSGGNQQKVVIAKWFNTDAKVIIMDEPTRGVDIGTKVEIYGLINELAEQGHTIIFISSEMMELMGMCDRLLVMNEGLIKGELNKEEFSEKRIMQLILGEN